MPWVGLLAPELRGDCVPKIFRRGKRSRSNRSAGWMTDGLMPSAPLDDLSCAERRAMQGNAGQRRPASQCHWRCTHTAVAQQRRCAGRDTQDNAVTRRTQWPYGSNPCTTRARLRRPELLRKITREQGPDCRRSTGASACRQGHWSPKRKNGLSCVFWRKTCRMARETVILACVAQGYPGQDAKPAARDDGMQLRVIRRKDVTRDVVLLPRR